MPEEQNPYASPAPLPHDQATQPVDPLRLLRGPSLGLLLSSALLSVGGGITLMATALESIVNDLEMTWPQLQDLLAVPMFLATIPIFIGAWNMRYGLRYRWAYAAAVLASIPMITPLFCWGLPLGIWALVVLHRRDVKEAFASKAAAANDPKDSLERPV